MSDVVAKQTIQATVNNSASINGQTNVPVIRYVKDTDLYPVIDQYIVEHDISNSPVKYVHSPDDDGNVINLRDLESGTYVLDGRFIGFQKDDRTTMVGFHWGFPVVIGRTETKTYLQCLYPPQNTVQYVEISDEGFYRNDMKLEYAMVGKMSTISLLASNWTVVDGTNNMQYKQTVYLNGVSTKHKVDLLPTPEQMQNLLISEISLQIVNEGTAGQVTAYAIGAKPTIDYSIQTLLTEVNSE